MGTFGFRSHLVPVIVPAIGASHDHHPVGAPVRVPGGERADQRGAQAEQGEQHLRQHVPAFCGSPQVKDRDDLKYIRGKLGGRRQSSDCPNAR